MINRIKNPNVRFFTSVWERNDVDMSTDEAKFLTLSDKDECLEELMKIIGEEGMELLREIVEMKIKDIKDDLNDRKAENDFYERQDHFNPIGE